MPEFREFGPRRTEYFSMILTKNSPLTPHLKNVAAETIENGLKSTLSCKWIDCNPRKAKVEVLHRLGIGHVILAFLLVIGSVFLAFIIFLAEKVTYTCSSKTKKQRFHNT